MKRSIPAFVSATILATSAVALGAQQLQLSVPMRYQERGNWCWVASDQMIIRYYGKYFDEQCEIVENYHARRPDWGTTNCCLSPDEGCNSPGGVGDEVSSMGISIGNPASPLSFAQSMAELDAGHPFATLNGFHWNVAAGYVNTATVKALIMMDPWPTEGPKIVDYATYAAGWYSTTTTSTPVSPYAKLYADSNLGGRTYTVTTGTSSFPRSIFLPSFDNTASSGQVIGSPYIFYDKTGYTGTAWGVNAKTCMNYTEWYGANDAVSSARPVPNTSYTPNGVVLFEKENFQGASTFVTDNDNLVSSGWNDRVNSLIVVGGLAQVFQDINAGGLAYAVTSFGGPHRDGFYPNPQSWGGPANDISSVHVYSDDMTAGASTSPIILYDHEDMTGRGLLIKWTAKRSGDDPIGWANYLGYQLMDDKVRSIKTFSGAWVVYADPFQTGVSATISGNRWLRNSTQIGLTGISSIGYLGADWTI